MFDLTVLGSGASLPTLLRRTTSVAVQRGGDIFLLDCGEGTQLQWRRAGLRFSKLRAICISHLHGDHVNGLVGLLQTQSLNGRVDEMFLFGPPGIAALLDAARTHVGMRLSFPLRVTESSGGALMEGDGYDLSCALIDHGPATLGFRLQEHERPGRFDVDAAEALGVPPGPLFGKLQRGATITLENGNQVAPAQVLGEPRPGSTVSYCVDTRPCAAAVQLARRASLFICDATFAEEMTLEARQRGHCTARQAAAMARDAGAERLLLIHVSARYNDPRPLLQEARTIFAAADIAHDLMQIQA